MDKNSVNPRVGLLMSHHPDADPRIGWLAHGFKNAGFEVVEIGTFRSAPACEEASVSVLAPNHIRILVPTSNHHWAFINRFPKINESGVVGDSSLHIFVPYVLPPREIVAARMGLKANSEQFNLFRWYNEYFLNTNSSLEIAIRLIGDFDFLVAADLFALPSALSCRAHVNASVIYDAHEFWSEAYAEKGWVYDFWESLEKAMARAADYCVTVSSPLANLMSKTLGVSFETLPNFEPRTVLGDMEWEGVRRQAWSRKNDEIHFLFQGGLHPERPVDQLIRCWNLTDEKAMLFVRAPDWNYKDELVALARQTGLLDKRIFFPPAVAESDLVMAAAEADVGIIPYDPEVNLNYKFACPNKFSQYLAAGLPIMTTDLEFISGLVREYELGTVFNIRDPDSIAKAVNSFVNARADLPKISQRNRKLFLEKFNWDSISQQFYAEVLDLLKDKQVREKHVLSMGALARGLASRFRTKVEVKDQAGRAAEIAESAVLSAAEGLEQLGKLSLLRRAVSRRLPSSLKSRLISMFPRIKRT